MNESSSKFAKQSFVPIRNSGYQKFTQLKITNGKKQINHNSPTKSSNSSYINGFGMINTDYQEASSPSEIDSPSSAKRKRENKGKKKTFLIKADDTPQAQKKIPKKGYPAEFVEIDQSGILKLGELVEQIFIKYEGYIHLTVFAGKIGSGKSQLLNKLLDLSGKQAFQTRKEKEHYKFGTVDLQIFSEPQIIKEQNIHCFYLDLQGIDETNISHLKLLLFAFLISDSFVWNTDDELQYSIHELSVFQQIQEKLKFKFNYDPEDYKIYPHFYYLIKGKTPHSIRINTVSPRGYFKSFIKEDIDEYQTKYNFSDMTNNSSNYYNNPLYNELKKQYAKQNTQRDYIAKDMALQESNKSENDQILSFDSNYVENNLSGKKQNQQKEIETFNEALNNSKLSFQEESLLIKSFKNLSSEQKQNIKQIFSDYYIDKLKLVFYKDIQPKTQKFESRERYREKNISSSNNSTNSLSFQNQNIYASTSSTHAPFSSSYRTYKKPIMSGSHYQKYNLFGVQSTDMHIQNSQKEAELSQETIEDVLSWDQWQIQNSKQIQGIYYNSRMLLTFLQKLLDQINLNKQISIEQIHFSALSKECEDVSNWCYEQFVEEMLAAFGDQMKPIDQLLYISLQIRENTINKYSIYFKQLDFRECSPFIFHRKKLRKFIDSYTKRVFELYFTTMTGVSEIQRKQLSRKIFSQIYENNFTKKDQINQSKDASSNNKTNRLQVSLQDQLDENLDLNTSLTERSLSDNDYTINEIENEEEGQSVDGKIKEMYDSRIILKKNFESEYQEAKQKQQKTLRNLYRPSIDNLSSYSRNYSQNNNQKKMSGYGQQSQKRISNPKVSTPSKMLISNPKVSTPSKMLISNPKVQTPSKILISNQELQIQSPIQMRETRVSYDGSNQIREEEQQLSEELCKQNKEKLYEIFNEAITQMRQFTEKYFLQPEESVQYPSISQYQHFIRHTYRKCVEKFTQQYLELYQKIAQQEEFLRFKDLKQMRDILFNRREILSKQDTAITQYIETLKTESSNTQKLIQQTHIFYLKNKDKYKLSLILQQKEEECKKLEEELQRLSGKNNSKQK